MGEHDVTETLEQVGPRLRAERERTGATLAELSAASGISISTLSRLESGGRKPTVELLLRLADAHGVPMEDLVRGPNTADPRVRGRAIRREGRTFVPLTRRPGGVQSFKVMIEPEDRVGTQRSHEGYEWLYVLDGRLRLLLGELDLVLGPGEVAEFDTRTPHWFGAAGDRPVELLSLFGPQGERLHVRARPRGR